MKNKIFQSNPWITQFLEDIKKRKFWSIQFLNLLRPIQFISFVLLLCYFGITILASFLYSRELSFSLHQQKLIIGALQTALLIIIMIHFISTVIKSAVNNNPEETIFSSSKIFISRLPLYFIGIWCLSLTLNSNFVNELFNLFPVSSIFLLLVVSLITEKVHRFVITREITAERMVDWLIIINDTRETTFVSSNDSLYPLSYNDHSVKVRLKYSRQYFVFSGMGSGKALNKEEMKSLLKNLPQMPKIKVMAVRGVGSESKFKREKHKE